MHPNPDRHGFAVVCLNRENTDAVAVVPLLGVLVLNARFFQKGCGKGAKIGIAERMFCGICGTARIKRIGQQMTAAQGDLCIAVLSGEDIASMRIIGDVGTEERYRISDE